MTLAPRRTPDLPTSGRRERGDGGGAAELSRQFSGGSLGHQCIDALDLSALPVATACQEKIEFRLDCVTRCPMSVSS